MQRILFSILFSFVFCSSQTVRSQNNNSIDALKINQIQTLGSHNSYHKRANKFVLNFLKGFNAVAPKDFKPKDLDYAHEPLQIQLDSFHLRSFEIDIYADPKGGQFYYRKKNNLLGKPKASKIEALKQPGFKVMHIPDVDYNSHFHTFKETLLFFKEWSNAHPNHLPIYIMLECKEETLADKFKKLHFVNSIKFTPELCDDLDKEVKAVFGDSLNNIITPDKIRGNYATLNDAVLAGNFPTVAEARGKIIFIVMQAGNTYAQNHPSLKDRAMFIFASPNQAECAFVKHDDPYDKSIADDVLKGYIVRTRADGPNIQNRSNDYAQQKAAFASGAQIISTDYYRPDKRYKKKPKKFKNYSTKLSENNVRINPINTSIKQ
jgi:hypothetical protein